MITLPAASLKAQRLASVLKNGLVVTLSSNEPARLSVKLLLDAKLAKRLKVKRQVGAATVSLTAAGSQKVALKLTATARRKLARQKPLKLTVSVRATDPAGNSITTSTTVIVKP